MQDTCNVWVIRNGREGVCIDFGAGAVLDRLDELGLDRVTDVLVTHHHRDSVQGLARAASAGARIWVPPVEQDLFTDARGFWQRRRTRNVYALRQDDFSLLDSVEIAGTVDEYRERVLRRRRHLHAPDAGTHARLGQLPHGARRRPHGVHR